VRPTYIFDHIELQAGNNRRAQCYLKASATATPVAWSSISTNADYVPTPAPNCGPDKGKVVSTDHYTVVSPSKLAAGVDVCIPVPNTTGGCAFTATARVGGFNKQTGKWEYQFMGPLTHSGNVCTGNGTGATDPVKEDVPTKCGAGMCVGTVNGVELCVKCAQTDTSNPATQTTVNPDGSTTQTNTTTNVSITDNSVTTTTTTTTTTTPAGGGTPSTQTKTDTKTEPKDSYCKTNPNDTQCKSISSASGGETCDTPPVCNGDAVQCMMVTQQWQTRCNLERVDDIVKAGQALGTAADPMAGQLPSPANAPQVDVGKISQDPLFTGGALDLSKTIMVGGMSVVIDATYVNQYAELMGYVNLICTAFVCAYMLKGVF